MTTTKRMSDEEFATAVASKANFAAELAAEARRARESEAALLEALKDAIEWVRGGIDDQEASGFKQAAAQDREAVARWGAAVARSETMIPHPSGYERFAPKVLALPGISKITATMEQPITVRIVVQPVVPDAVLAEVKRIVEEHVYGFVIVKVTCEPADGEDE